MWNPLSRPSVHKKKDGSPGGEDGVYPTAKGLKVGGPQDRPLGIDTVVGRKSIDPRRGAQPHPEQSRPVTATPGEGSLQPLQDPDLIPLGQNLGS